MRRSPKVAEVLPILYLRGLSTGDFQEGLKALLGEEAAGLSPSNISKLLSVWGDEYERFRTRDLSDRITSTSGPTGFTSTSAWRRIVSARWSSWGRGRTARRN